MKTKLVYVLTCAPEATYIEQALMSVYSARHWNPDAHIVLMVDDKSNALLTGKRGEILNYVSEKIVVPFEDESLTPMYRSRWIKTQVRHLIKGDFLFVDSDTICCRSIGEIDDFECEVGAVLESHLPVSEFCDALHRSAQNANEIIGVDVDIEQLYFSSGVLLVRDTKKTHKLYELWHQFWKEGNEIGLKIDQPSLAKANREMGHIIQQIPDSYNCILFTRPPFVREAHILHIAAYQNPSFLFTNKVLNYVKVNGIGNAWLQKMILHPCATMMPFDYNLKHSTFRQRRQWRKELVEAWKGYGEVIDKTYTDFPILSRLQGLIINLLKHRYIKLALYITMLWQRIHLQRAKSIIKPNMCAK
jgi:lipopolysaccharide biosynthesis glycosyltransferase